jgi:hypothetical protein
MLRPDFSDYVVHFTKDPSKEVKDKLERIPKEIKTLNAYDRLIKILKDRTILGTEMKWTNEKAACFTECTWMSLLDHANNYSPYGIGFHKSLLFAAGGGPAIYLRPDLKKYQDDYIDEKAPLLKGRSFHPKLWAFVTPFVPEYAPREHMKKAGWIGTVVDYSHEREWRVPHELNFTYNKVEFIILNTYEEMAKFPKDLKDEIGRDKFLLMDNFRQIEKLWPTHKIQSF